MVILISVLSVSTAVGGAPLTFKFTGSELYLMMYHRVCVEIRVTDGVNEYVFANPEEFVFTDLEKKEYTVTITMTGFDYDDETGLNEPPYIFGMVYR